MVPRYGVLLDGIYFGGTSSKDPKCLLTRARNYVFLALVDLCPRFLQYHHPQFILTTRKCRFVLLVIPWDVIIHQYVHPYAIYIETNAPNAFFLTFLRIVVVEYVLDKFRKFSEGTQSTDEFGVVDVSLLDACRIDIVLDGPFWYFI